MPSWSCTRCSAVAMDLRPVTCPACGASGSYRPCVRRATSELLAEAVAGNIVVAADLMRTSWAIERCRWTSIAFSPPAIWLLHGEPGGGKSLLGTLVVTQFAPVFIQSIEESAGPSLARRLGLAGCATRRDVEIDFSASVDRLAAAAKRGCAILIDSVSVTTYEPTDLHRLAQLGAPVICAILQNAKDGSARGSLEWSHAADLTISVSHGSFTVSKNRYGATGITGEVPYYSQPYVSPRVAPVGETVIAFPGTTRGGDEP